MASAFFLPASPGRRLRPRHAALLLAGLGSTTVALLMGRTPEPAEAPIELIAPSAPSIAAPPPPLSVAAQAPALMLATGVTLRGIFATAAIMAVPGSPERIIRVGRDVVPGLRLKNVGVAHAILEGASGEVRLDLGKAGAEALPSEQVAALAPANDAGPIAQQREETLAYRLAMEPVGTRGAEGYRIKSGQPLPHLSRAGLRPGDVIVGVNGSGFNEERMLELSWQIANSSRTDFEVLRGGKKITLSLPTNE